MNRWYHSGMKVLIAGDTHGNTRWLLSRFRVASRLGVKRMIVPGDFGMWTDRRLLKKRAPHPLNVGWLTHIAEHAARCGVTLVFPDGNHDNHPDARALYPADCDGIRWIVDGVLGWADRGSVWTWGGVRFGALGGAVSSDSAGGGTDFNGRDIRPRRPGVDWWPDTEPVTSADVEALRARGPVDVLVTHDAPSDVNVPHLHESRNVGAPLANRVLVRAGVNASKPKLVVHGHHHVGHVAMGGFDHETVRVIGLAADTPGFHPDTRNQFAWGLLDLDDLSFGFGADTVYG